MRCKQGQLAYIINALRPENIGKPVTTMKYLGYFMISEPIAWGYDIITACISYHFWVIESQSGIETLYGGSKQAVIPDSWLKPIDEGTPDVTESKSKDLETL